MKKYEWILFDFDGTLVDTLALNLSMINNLGGRIFRNFEPITVDEVKEKGFWYYFKKYRIRKRYIPFVVLFFQILTKRLYRKVYISNEIRSLIIDLNAKGYKLGIVSSLNSSIVKSCLKRSALNGYFRFVSTSPSLFSKEKILTRAILKNNIKLNSVVYVGDEVRDINASKKVNIPVIAVEGGFATRERLIKANANNVIGSLAELVNLL
ncbi:MAG TPA: HAD-IA family hydrolase [Candidatus Dojkabacteria bacterium]|nr:HAD-IA family hydrolase [Candidatus Dojkabacteria bacterium]HQF36436.1 HAD-IA family hydrolase [Candidatus Dojkabacteria bacterium]